MRGPRARPRGPPARSARPVRRDGQGRRGRCALCLRADSRPGGAAAEAPDDSTTLSSTSSTTHVGELLSQAARLVHAEVLLGPRYNAGASGWCRPALAVRRQSRLSLRPRRRHPRRSALPVRLLWRSGRGRLQEHPLAQLPFRRRKVTKHVATRSRAENALDQHRRRAGKRYPRLSVFHSATPTSCPLSFRRTSWRDAACIQEPRALLAASLESLEE